MRKPQLLLAIGGIFVVAGGSLAQAQQQTTATYGDWTVRCVVAEGQKVKQCEMIQTANIQGQSNPISQIAIGRPAKTESIKTEPTKTEPVKVVFQLPVGIWLPGGVKLVFDAKAPALDASFKRCLPAACLADAELKDDIIKKLRAVAEPGKLNFEDGNRKPIALPVSFKGFGEAFDALAKE